MRFRYAVAALFTVSASMCLMRPAAAVLVSGAYVGTVASGFDAIGAFGPPGTNLGGDSFSLVLSYDTALAPAPVSPYAGNAYFSEYKGSPFASVVLSISGHEQTYDSSVSQLLTINKASSFDQLEVSISNSGGGPGRGIAFTLNFPTGSLNLLSLPATLPSGVLPDSGGTFYDSYIDRMGYVQSNDAGQLAFTPTASVPEPPTGVLLIGAAALIAARLRRPLYRRG